MTTAYRSSRKMRLFVVPLLPPSLVRFLRAPRGQAMVGSDWLSSGAFSRVERSRGAFDDALDESGLGRVKDIGDLCVAMTEASSLAMLLHWEDRSSMARRIKGAHSFPRSPVGR
jgi:asparagine synthase (glutamine-hydrolysing)